MQLVRLAVESGLFPLLYEVWDGRYYRVNVEPEWADPADYYARQRRFPADSIDLEVVRRECRESYEWLSVLAERFPYEGKAAVGGRGKAPLEYRRDVFLNPRFRSSARPPRGAAFGAR